MIKHSIAALGALAFLCGITGAQASPFQIVGEITTPEDGEVNFTLDGDKISTSGSFTYFEDDLDILNREFGTTFTDPHATLSIGPTTETLQPPFGERQYDAVFDVSDPTFSYMVSDPAGNVTTRVGYNFSFDLFQLYDLDFVLVDDGFLTASPIVTGNDGILGSGAFLTGNPLGVVPLPATGWLFAAALVGLGGVSWRWRLHA